MRGKVNRVEECRQITRITPAYAGKSLPKDGTAKKAEDHPRLCGEKRHWHMQKLFCRGSPPPMRGKGSNYMQESDVTGITPAYAGKRRRFCSLTVAI